MLYDSIRIAQKLRMSHSAQEANVENSTVELHGRVFYDPNLFHYLSSGWDLSELLSQRVHTSTGIFAPLTLTVPATHAEENSLPRHRLQVSQLRREALRALLVGAPLTPDVYEQACSVAGTTSVATVSSAEDSLDAAVERWAPFVYVSLYGGKRLSPADQNKSSSKDKVNDASALIIIEDDEEEEATTKPPTMPPGLQRSAPPTVKQWPVVVSTAAPGAAAASVVVVLSFVKDAQTWRKMRRDARLAATADTTAAAASTHNVQTHSSCNAVAESSTSPALYVSNDDALFTQWMHAKLATRQQWQHQQQQQQLGHSNNTIVRTIASDGSPCVDGKRCLEDVPPTAESAASNRSTTDSSHDSSSSRSSSSSEADEDGKQDSSAPPSSLPSAEDVEARRAAVLAAIARRRK